MATRLRCLARHRSHLGWRSIVSTYEAIFAFDLGASLRRIAAPTLVLELQAEQERHFGAQAPLICGLMKHARALVLADCDAGVFRTRPQIVADAVLPFLREG